MKRVYLAAAAAILIVVGGLGWYFYGPTTSPAGQPPLTFLNSGNFEYFEQAFNEATGTVRVLLLLSPT